MLKEVVGNKIDILLISEAKLDTGFIERCKVEAYCFSSERIEHRTKNIHQSKLNKQTGENVFRSFYF